MSGGLSGKAWPACSPQSHLAAASNPLCLAGVKQEETRLGEGEEEPLLVVGSVNWEAVRRKITSQGRGGWGVRVCVGGRGYVYLATSLSAGNQILRACDWI